MKMGGQYGNTRITVQNLQIMRVDPEKNLLYVSGAIPGPNTGLVSVRTSKKQKKKQPA